MKKISRKEREFQRREQEILESSLSLFIEHGVDNVSVDRIAEEVGIAKGTVYNHFKSKEEIFVHLYIQLGAKLIQRVQELDRSLPVLEQIKHYLSIYMDFSYDNIEEFKLYMNFKQTLNQPNINSTLHSRMDDQERFLHQFAEKIVQKGIDEGVLKDIPVSHLVCMGDGIFLGVINASMNGYYSSTLGDKRELFRNLGEVLMNGILKR